MADWVEIDYNDLIDFNIELSLDNTDNARVSLMNKNGKYNYLYRMFQTDKVFIGLDIGFDNEKVPVFTGQLVSLSSPSFEARRLELTLKHRLNYFEIAKIPSDHFYDINFGDLVTYHAVNYWGLNSNEIIIKDDISGDDYLIKSVFLSNEPPLAKLYEIAKGLGLSIYCDELGRLIIQKNYNSTTPVCSIPEDKIKGWSSEFMSYFDIDNHYEIFGAEKPLDYLLDEKEKVLGYKMLDLRVTESFFPQIASFENYPQYSKDFLLNYKGQNYTPDSSGGISLLPFGIQPILQNNIYTPPDILVIDIPMFEKEYILTDIDVKYNKAQEGINQGNRGESWICVTNDLEIYIAGFGDNVCYIVIKNFNTWYEQIKPLFILVTAFGWGLSNWGKRYKTLVKTDSLPWINFWAYDKVTSPKLLQFHKEHWLVDVQTNQRLADLIGLEKKRSYNYEWIFSDAQADFVLNNLVNQQIKEIYQITVTTTLNPLFERNDLIEAIVRQGDKKYKVQFWVRKIQHTLTTTTLTGPIYQWIEIQ